MGQLGAFKSDIKFLFPKLSKVKNKTDVLKVRRYDYNYMFQTYGLHSHSFLEWMLNKMRPTGCETVLDYSYLKHLLHDEEKLYFNSFKQVYVSAIAEHHIQANLKLIDCCSNVKVIFNRQFKLAVPSNSFDYIYVNHRHSCFSKEQKSLLLREFLRTLKSDGEFYITSIAKNHYLSIQSLFDDYEKEMMDLSFCDESVILESVAPLFEQVSLETYESELFITNADDLINYILLNSELNYFSSLISSQGISKLRQAISQRILYEGGILIPYHVNVIKGSQKIQLKLV